jgi:hypothetical protein
LVQVCVGAAGVPAVPCVRLREGCRRSREPGWGWRLRAPEGAIAHKHTWSKYTRPSQAARVPGLAHRSRVHRIRSARFPTGGKDLGSSALLVIWGKRNNIATSETRVVTSKLLVNQWRSEPSSRGDVSRIFMAFPSGSMVSSVSTHGPYPCASVEWTSASG